jgi:hypothetical protein
MENQSQPPAAPANDLTDAVEADRRPAPDVIVSRDGSTLEVSISRRGLHRIGVLLAVAVSVSVVWAVLSPAAPAREAVVVKPEASSILVPTEQPKLLAKATASTGGESVPLTVVLMQTVVPTASPDASRLPVTPIASDQLPSGVGYVVAVDGTVTDIQFSWDGQSPSSSTDWAFELWLRPKSVASGIVYAEAPPSLGTALTRVVWIDGSDVWAAGTHSAGVRGAFVARGVADWRADTWHHLGVSWSGGVPVVVADGRASAMVYALTFEDLRPSTSDRVNGHLFPVGLNGGFSGEFDDLRVWKYPRTGEIGEDRLRRVSPDAQGLIRYFPASAVGGAGAVIEDVTRQGKPLQLLTGVRWVTAGQASDVGTLTAALPEVVTADELPLTQTPITSDAPMPQQLLVTSGFGSSAVVDWVLSGGARPIGDGWVRLAEAMPMQMGVARFERDLPLGTGLSVRFAYRMTAGNGPAADGIVAFLWDPAAGQFTTGYGAGSLGYGRYCRTGLTGAIFGLGIDTYGTFGSAEPTCNDAPSRIVPNALSVRGSGSGSKGYGLIATSALRRALDGRDGGEQVMEVTIYVFPDGSLSVLTRYSSETVPTEDIKRVAFLSPGAMLPGVARFGFAGTTGGLYADHDVRDVSVWLGGV